MLHRQRVDLRDSRFADTHQLANLAHGKSLLVVQHKHPLLAFWQMGNRFLKRLFTFHWLDRG